ncbi:MAG: hypothetical protein H6Q67_11 [Firmicutes bacterium]|nr:hypothetical protein [Bacillota bacterium]
MNVRSLNGMLERLAHYVSRITALKGSEGLVCSKNNIMLTKRTFHLAPNV